MTRPRGSRPSFGERELGDILAAGRVTPDGARLWARLSRARGYALELWRANANGGKLVGRFAVDPGSSASDHTVAWNYPDEFDGAPSLEPDAPYRAYLMHDGEPVASAQFETAPIDPPDKWTFAALSCHQPFAKDGSMYDEAESMLRAAHEAFAAEHARFALLMGDQIYADYPPSHSLFDPDYFATIAPPGRADLLSCDRHEVRAIYQQRHRQFWGAPQFRTLQSSLACMPMLDDHEVVDNFGTHPDHTLPKWDSVRHGALDAFYDYQAARVLPRPPSEVRPTALDYGFTWGQGAFWMMDNRSQRRTIDGTTACFAPSQLDALRAFIDEHRELPLLVLTTPIPLVHVEGRLADAAGKFLGQGSDMHERWSHAQCVAHRDRLLAVLLHHCRAYPHQTLLLLGGDVHTGAAFEIDFVDGPRVLQLTSSAVSNRESMLMSLATERAAKTIAHIRGEGIDGDVDLLPGLENATHNPYGDLNVGLVDVLDRGEGIGLRLRLLGHDGEGHPITVYDSDEQLTHQPDRRWSAAPGVSPGTSH